MTCNHCRPCRKMREILEEMLKPINSHFLSSKMKTMMKSLLSGSGLRAMRYERKAAGHTPPPPLNGGKGAIFICC